MRKIFALFVALALLPFSHTAVATMKGLSTEELTREADIVVEGTVDGVESYWSGDGKRILSSATIVVTETVRGQENQTSVTVEYEGGAVGNIGMKVSDMEPFTKGERVLVFLKYHRASKKGGIHRLVGMSQGKYSIGEDGVARKKGYSLAYGSEVIDNDLDVNDLKRMIRAVR